MLVELRDAAGMTQLEFASEAGLSTTTISSIERAQRDDKEHTVEESTFELLSRYIGAGYERVLVGLRTTRNGKRAGGYGATGRRSKAPGVCGVCQYELPVSNVCGSDICN
jgi:transcriptional regulator with XRE-family HTH domain